MYAPGDTIAISFSVESGGALIDADADPTIVVRRNGANDYSVATSLGHADTGDYTAIATLPLTYSGGDSVELVVSYTVSGLAMKQFLRVGPLDRTAQAVAQVVHRSPKVWFVNPAGDPSYDGLSPATAKALPTQPTPGPGETILLFSGTYALGAAGVDLAADGVTGAHLVGAGMDAATIASDLPGFGADGAGCIVHPGNGSLISDLSVAGNGGGGQYAVGLEWMQQPFDIARISRVHLTGNDDAIHIDSGSSPVSIVAADCVLNGMTRGARMYSPSAVLRLENCDISGGGVGILSEAGTIIARDSRLSGPTAAYATYQGSISVERTRIASSGADLVGGANGISVTDCAYTPANTSGSISSLNTVGGGLTQQQIADALLLAPGGDPAGGSAMAGIAAMLAVKPDHAPLVNEDGKVTTANPAVVRNVSVH